MKKAFIKALNYFVPEGTLSNETLVAEFPEWSVEKIAAKVGIRSRHVAGAGETASDLAVCAAEKLFAEAPELRERVDFVLFCTQSPDYFLPTSACVIQKRLGLSTSCGALDFNLGCSGYVYGLSLAKGLVCGGVAKNVLLLTGETYSKHLHPRDKGNRTIFGDGASATVVSEEGFAEILNFSLGTDGNGAGNLIVGTGGMRARERVGDLAFDEGGNPKSSDFLFMNGSEIFEFTLDVVPPLVRDVLAKNGLAKEDLDLVVFHQANKYMLDYLRRKLKFDESRFFISMETTGNTVSSTIPIALCEARTQNRLRGNVLLAGFGVGYSWGGVVLAAR